MALPHAAAGQVLDVRPLGAQAAQVVTKALFKSRDLEVIRVVLQAGKALPPHRVPGDITIQCIEGLLDVQLDRATVRLGPGEMLFLDGHTVHGVLAVADATALVTLALKP